MASNTKKRAAYRLSAKQHAVAVRLTKARMGGRALGHTVVAREIGVSPATFEQGLWGGGHTACDLEGEAPLHFFRGNGHVGPCACETVFYQARGWTKPTYEKIAAYLEGQS